MTYCTRFTVSGNGRFPYDMLRYDGCFPTRESPAFSDTKQRNVELAHNGTNKQWQPSTARWQSFGWQVTQTSPAFKLD